MKVSELKEILDKLSPEAECLIRFDNRGSNRGGSFIWSLTPNEVKVETFKKLPEEEWNGGSYGFFDFDGDEKEDVSKLIDTIMFDAGGL